MSVPILTFLSDYGYEDGFAGVCHGVIAYICPEAHVIDITHGVPRHDVRAGALVLRDAVPYTPVGVHLAVVDPDVGAARRAVALGLEDGRRLVGPDNGLLWLAAEQAGIVEAVDIARSPFRLEPVSATFHGRDIFAPVAARLAAGRELAEVGRPLDPEGLVRLELPRPRLREDGVLVAHAAYVDRYGNVQLNVDHALLAGTGLRLGRALELQVGSGRVYSAHFALTFADVEAGELLVYEDASRHLAIAVSHGDAARRLGLEADDKVWITSA